MKCFNKLSLMWLAWMAFAMSAQGQPCVHSISTNPQNPVNNQFVPLANAWFPGNGTDTHNPWLNQWSWYWSDGNPTIYRANLNWAHQWPGNAPNVAMVHPYDASMPEGFEYLRPAGVHPDLYDYRWEDGWELLWMNLGYYPDGHPINDPAPGSYYDNHNWNYEPLPSNAPYFAIYNRYRGLLRLFANVWYSAESTFENIDVVLRFTTISGDQNKLTGLLRHASAYDRALSEPTDITEIHAPRFHAPDLTQWIVADFQMGYDPCSCNSTGELILDFNAFSTMNVDIIGRTVGLEVPINDTTYTTRDFLNMSDVNVGDYVPGTEIYQNMDRLAEQYRKRQLKYVEDLVAYNEELEEQNQFAPLRFALEIVGIKAVADFIANGITNITLSDSLYTWINTESPAGFETIEQPLILGALPPGSSLQLPMPMTQVLDSVIIRSFTDKAKKEIGRVFGNFSAEIFKASKPGKPTPPTVPVATLEESVYKGTIVNTATRASSPLIIPGSLAQAWEPATPLSPGRLPIYNEVLGVAALLDIPSINLYSKFHINSAEWNFWRRADNATCGLNLVGGINYDFKLRFDQDFPTVLNTALDFNFDLTRTYVSLEIFLKVDSILPDYNDVPLYGFEDAKGASNLNLTELEFHTGKRIAKYNSDWISLEELNQYIFSLELHDQKISSTVCSTGQITTPEAFCGCHQIAPSAPPPIENSNFFPDFDLFESVFSLERINMKVMHDMYFNQIGTSNEPLNTLHVHTYQLINQSDGINNLDSDPSIWSQEPLSGQFDQYIPILISIGNEDITLSHPYVHSVVGTDIFIRAREVVITGELEIPAGYSLVIQALEQIRIVPSLTSLNPRVRLQIKKDFYDTPIFEYADQTTVSNFCSQNGPYQANTSSRPLMERIITEREERAALEKTNAVELNKISLHPNPTSNLINLSSSRESISQVEIYDLSGRRLIQEFFGDGGGSQVQLNLSALSNGVYVVRATSGGKVFTERLVVSK